MKRALLTGFSVSVLAVLLLVAGVGTSAVRARGRVASACSGPVVHDPYDGFHVGVPAGWQLSTLYGIIVVHQDTAGTIEGVVSPAILTASLTPARFFAATTTELKKLAAGGGNELSFHVMSTNGGLTQATVTGRSGSVTVSGRAGVSLIADPTAHGSRLVVFTGYWAPPGRLAAERSKLVAIGACYGPQPGALFRIVKDQAFTYPIPPGWTIGGEGQNNLFLDDGPDASANYIFWEPLTPSQGVTDAQSLLNYTFGQIGVKVDTVLATVSAPNTTTAAGGTGEAERVEFLGTVNGTKQVHAIATVTATTGGGVTSGAVRLAISTPALWNSLNGALIQVANGIEHDFTQDLAQLRQVQQQLDAFGQQVEGFDYALNGNDLVQNTATGQQFEAPYTAFNQSGPDGPGYYTGSPGNLQKLQIITPS